MVAAAVAGSAIASVAGSALSASAAGSAANAQVGAANNATAAQMRMFEQSQGNLYPFIQAGQGANSALSTLLGTNSATGDGSGAGTADHPGTQYLVNQNQAGGVNQVALNGYVYSVPESLGPNWQTSDPGVSVIGPYNPTPAGNPLTSYFGPITPNLATIAQTPGYQFNLYQGLKSTQNNATARGLGISGAALKGAANFATGLSDSTYQNQFNNLLTNQSNVYNRLFGQSQLGANAAAGAATNAQQTGANIGSNIIGAGNASAAGQIGAANAISGGLNNAASSFSQTAILNQLLKQNGGTGLFSGNGNANVG